MAHVPPLNRRDFLKLLALTSASLFVDDVSAFLHSRLNPASKTDSPGVIIIVLDTLSASNLSLYGYPRKTSPHLERFARRSTVYHSHTSAANFTSSGTASLLTGLYPWTHRAFHYEGLISKEAVESNLFRYWGGAGKRIGYTQNAWADLLLYQFSSWLDEHVDLRAFNLDKKPLYTALLRNDAIASHKSLDSFAYELEAGLSAASLSSLLRKARLYFSRRALDRKFTNEYPLGIPQTLNDLDSYFLLEDLFDGLMQLTAGLPKSGLAYLHLFPPHYPHAPRAEFIEQFSDGWQPPVKPLAHFLASIEPEKEQEIQKARDTYDAYVATVDEEFGRLFDFMEREGILERNYVVLTTDHGEIHERGVLGHTNEYLYEPLVHIPLVISSPGQTSQVDVRTPTSSVDVTPTLLSLTGRLDPAFEKASLLPGLGGRDDPDRSVFSIDAKSTPVRGPIRTATFSLRKGQYKLISYFGHEGFEAAEELFDLKNDPGEMNDLARSKPGTLAELKHEIRAKLDEVNEPYLPR